MAKKSGVQPWDRQPDETAPAYAAFQAYLDLGPDRSIRKAAQVVGKSMTSLGGWSKTHDWVARSEAWDSIPRRALAEAYEDMAARIAAQHEGLASALMEKLRANVDLLKPGKDPTVSFSTALGAARQSHQFAAELSKPQDTAREEIANKIAQTLARLAGGDE